MLPVSGAHILTGAASLAALCIVAIIAHILLVDDPLGGEPVAIVALEEPAAPVMAEATLEMRRSLPDAREELPALEDSGELLIRQPDGSLYETAAIMPSVTVNPALVERSKHGLLPKIGPDGQRPADAYARPAGLAETAAVRIAVVVTGIGLSTTASEAAIDRLPGTIALAFAPYGRELDRLTTKARQDGHELLLQVPLEPYDFPDNDPGPHTLLTGLSQGQNRDRLHWVMSRFSGYVGITNHMGARFTASERNLRPFLAELRERGLVYLDDGASPRSLAPAMAREVGLPFLAADVVIDAVATRQAISDALARLEHRALENGLAVGVASGLPVSVEEIAAWAAGLDREGIQLVPVSSVFRPGQT